MEIQIVSDLHREFKNLEDPLGFAPVADILVIAGDICVSLRPLELTLSRIAKLYRDVVIVLGNHDYYGWRIEDLLAKIKVPENVHLLDNSSIKLEGQRFIGGTLWFGNDPAAQMYKSQLADFSQVSHPEDIYEENRATRNYLLDNIQPGDVVITHHLPTYKSVAHEFTNSVFNSFFVSPLPEAFELEPKLWIHGHTHSQMDYELNHTRVICNPMGYLHSPNYRFNPGLTVSL